MRHETYAQYKGHQVTVAAGYDVPMEGYFMTVEALEDDCPDVNEETGMIYSNLDDKDLADSRGMSQSVEHYKRRLKELQITVPEIFFAKVLAD